MTILLNPAEMEIPGKPLPQPSPSEITGDGNALREEEAFQKGYNLEDQKTLNAIQGLKRADRLDSHIHNILVAGSYGASFIIFLVFCWLVWNEVAPYQMRLLSPDEIADVYKFLFSGGVGVALKTMFSRLNDK